MNTKLAIMATLTIAVAIGLLASSSFLVGSAAAARQNTCGIEGQAEESKTNKRLEGQRISEEAQAFNLGQEVASPIASDCRQGP
jgi:MFS superfamily sulfate permease-like transporter